MRPFTLPIIAMLLLTIGGLTSNCSVAAGLDEDFVQAIPNGWDGPLLLLSSDAEPSACPTDFNDAGVLHSELNKTFTNVDCSCETPEEACAPTLSIYSSKECSGEPKDTIVLPPLTCVAVNLNQEYGRTTPATSVQCMLASASLPEVTWQQNTRLCTGSAGTCIQREGDIDCPSGPFTERQLLFSHFEDTRGCDCGSIDPECEGAVAAYGPLGNLSAFEMCSSFPDLPATVLQFGSCKQTPGQPYVRYKPVADGIGCSANDNAAANGTVTAAEPTTICCVP